MIPKSLSASSLLVSEACLARWKVENHDKAPQASSEPADIGTTCHFALEHFVKAVYLDERVAWDDVKYLNDMYEIGYVETFGTTNTDTDAFRDGAAMVAKWYDTNKGGLPHKVISCEVKSSFDVNTSIGPIPFNYIWDRFDQIDETTFEVVDYKSWRKPVSSQDMKKKIQPRAYALAAQIEHPEAEKIWVSFDQLRYEMVGTVFTKEDNAATWRYLKKAAERIIATDENAVEEKLNPDCKWCIRKASCDTLLAASAGGAVVGLSFDEVVRRKDAIANALIALKYADDELDKMIIAEAQHQDKFELETDDYEVKLSSRPRRSPNSSAIAHIVGPDLSLKYGNFTMTQIDKMLKNEKLSEAQIAEIQSNVNQTWSEPSAKVTRKVDFTV